MRKKSILINVSLLFLTSMFLACSYSTQPDQPQNAALKGLGLDNARAIYVDVREGGVQSGQSLNGVIYKLTDNGEVEQVPYISTDGDTLSTRMIPVDFFDAGQNHFIMGFVDATGNLSDGHLIRISDGKSYRLDGDGLPLYPSRQTYFRNAGTVQEDNQGNLYFMNFYPEANQQQHIYKLELAEEDLLIERVSPSSSNAGYYFVDGVGNVAIAQQGGFNGPILVTAELKEFELPSVNFWVTANKTLFMDDYTVDENDSTKNTHEIVEFSTVGDTVAADTVRTGLQDGIVLTRGLNLLLRSNGRTMIIVTNEEIGESAWDVTEEETPQPVEGIVDQFSEFKAAASSGNSYYISGTGEGGAPVLTKIDPASYEVSVLTTEYDVQSFSVSQTLTQDEIIFTGTRAGDDVNIVGHINGNGEISILADSLRIPAPGLKYLE